MAERLEAKVMLSAVVANDDSFGVLHTSSLVGADVIVNDFDNSPFMEGLTASVISDVSHGTLSLDPGGYFDYQPSGTYVGVDTFVYEVSNSYGSDQATVTINVGNIAPVADDLTLDVPHSTTLSDVWVSAIDMDGDTLTFSLDGGVSAGSLLFNGDGSFSYTPPVGFVTTPGNPVTFDYIVDDGFDTDTGTVSINVYNVTPTAEGDGSYGTLEAVTLTVDAADGLLANDWDFDGDAAELVVSHYTQPENGTVSVASDGSFEYTPDADFVGNDYFEYRVQDPQGAESQLARVDLGSGKLEIYTELLPAWLDNEYWIGELVSLRAEVVGPANPLITAYQWSVSGKHVEGFSIGPNQATGHADLMEAADYQNSTIAFHWVEGFGAQYNVTVEATIDGGGQSTAEEDFTVYTPDISVDTYLSQNVLSSLVPPAHISVGFQFGVDENDPGVRFTASDYLTTSLGTVRWVQDVEAHAVLNLNPPADEDGDIILPPNTQWNGPGQYAWHSGLGLDHILESSLFQDFPSMVMFIGTAGPGGMINYSNYFLNQLQWRSGRAGSIYVPVYEIQWGWGFSATAVEAQEPDPEAVLGWKWQLDANPWMFLNGPLVATDYLEWDKKIDFSPQGVVFQPEP